MNKNFAIFVLFLCFLFPSSLLASTGDINATFLSVSLTTGDSFQIMASCPIQTSGQTNRFLNMKAPSSASTTLYGSVITPAGGNERIIHTLFGSITASETGTYQFSVDDTTVDLSPVNVACTEPRASTTIMSYIKIPLSSGGGGSSSTSTVTVDMDNTNIALGLFLFLFSFGLVLMFFRSRT